MQLKVFTIPISNPIDAEKQVNAFLRGHRVLEVAHEFVHQGADSQWCLLVKTLENAGDKTTNHNRPERIDYKEVLDEQSFARFCALRKARKAVAEKEGVPAFAIFTDKQMAELAKTDPLTLEAMGKVDGIGPGKTEKYGAAILERLAGQRHPSKDTDRDEARG